MAEREPRRFGAVWLWWVVFAIETLAAVGDLVTGQHLRAAGMGCLAVVVLILALSAGRPEPVARGIAVLFVIMSLAILLSRFFMAPLDPVPSARETSRAPSREAMRPADGPAGPVVETGPGPARRAAV